MIEKNIIAKNPNIQLRLMTEQDLSNRVMWFNDPAVNQFLILNEKLTLEKTKNWFETAKTSQNRKDLVIETNDGKAVGFIGFRQISNQNKTACFYIVIGDKSVWGKGVGTEATKLLFKWGFEEMGLNKIWSNVRADNKASLKMLPKVGFVQEGLLREEEIINGKKTDVVRFGLLKTDFQNS